MTAFKRILAIAFIFAATSVAWFILGGVAYQRSPESVKQLHSRVGDLWGPPLEQQAPRVRWVETIHRKEPDKSGKLVETVETVEHPVSLSGSDVRVDLKLEHRKKGLLWFSTYEVTFDGDFSFRSSLAKPGEFVVSFPFPSKDTIYDDFVFRVEGRETGPAAGNEARLRVAPAEEKKFQVRFASRGQDKWIYRFGPAPALRRWPAAGQRLSAGLGGVEQVENFRLRVSTNFQDFDFPDGTLAASGRQSRPEGWDLEWRFKRLVTGTPLGVELPARLNPGPLAARVSFFAPVSLLFFFFVLLMLCVARGVRLHPMHYFFLAAAFFSFHLLFAYLIDHLDVHIAFALAAGASVALVVLYLRAVAGGRFAVTQAAPAQLVYLVLFSYSHFLPRFTGLTVALFATATLALMMRLTAHVDWEKTG